MNVVTARAWRAFSLLLSLSMPAHASGLTDPSLAPADPDAAPASDGQDADNALYLKALQSIAEGRRQDASIQLGELTARQPEHAGAWLDLALTQCSLGNAEQAERLFAAFETRFDPARPILEMIANSREQGCDHWDAFSSAVVMAGRGIDQNVNQGARTSRFTAGGPTGQVEYELSDDFRPRHDQYVHLSGDYVRELTPNGVLGFAQYQFRRNDRLHQYDSASLFTGIEKPWRLGRWRLRGTGSLGLVTLGSQLYQRQAQVQARVSPPLTGSVQADLITGITYNKFPTLTNFDSTTQDLRGSVSWRGQDGYASASLGYQHDHARALRQGGNRNGRFASVLARWPLGRGIIGELGYTHQSWRSSSAYSPRLIEQTRAQETQTLRSTFVYPINQRQSIQLEARLVRNRENISIFQYNNRQLQLSWQWQPL